MKKYFMASLGVVFTLTIGWQNAPEGTKTNNAVAEPSALTVDSQSEKSPKAVAQAWLEAIVAGDLTTAKSFVVGIPEVLIDQVLAGMIQYAKGQPLPILQKEEISGDKAVVIDKNGERIPLCKIDGKWKIDLSITLEVPEQTLAVEIQSGSPMEAMLFFYDAMIAGDIEKIKMLVTGTPEAFRTDKAAEEKFLKNMAQGFQAVTGGLGQRPMLSGEKINGDTATVTNEQGMEFPLPLKKVDGKWKINLAPMFQQ